MQRKQKMRFTAVASFIMLAIGIATVLLSLLYSSSFIVIMGLAFIFWGVILFYVVPSRHIPKEILNASADPASSNIERILAELNFGERGIYLPPKSIKDIESGIVFVPKTSQTTLPLPEDASDRLLNEKRNGVFLTPPGLSLSRLFEQELGISFTKMNLFELQKTLPKLLVEDMQLAESMNFEVIEDCITLEVTGSVFDQISQQTTSHPRMYRQVGCILASAIACALAKATGRPIIVQAEIQNPETRTISMEFRIKE
jgi:hypothetical protein